MYLRLVKTEGQTAQEKQDLIDDFYAKHGPCCAGCDWWHWYSLVAGECTRTAPVPGAARISMLGLSNSSLAIESGHIMTLRDHVCGEFKDGK